MNTKEDNRLNRFQSYCREKVNKYHLDYDRPSKYLVEDQITIFGFSLGLFCTFMFMMSMSQLVSAPVSNIVWFLPTIVSIGGIVLCRRTISRGIKGD